MASLGEDTPRLATTLDPAPRPSSHASPAADPVARAPEAAAHRYVLLDGLRGLAALAVVMHHFTSQSGHRELFASAPLAVDFFFCLSGFVIAHAYLPRLRAGLSLARFSGKRLARLYPMYAIGTLLGLLALLMLRRDGSTDLGPAAIATSFTLNLLYLPYLNGAHVHVLANELTGTLYPLNSPSWSLFFELVANGLFALTIVRWPRSPLAWAGVSAMGLCAATWAFGETPGWSTANIWGGVPRVLFAFFAGVVVFQCATVVARLPRLHPAWVALPVALMLAVPRFPAHPLYWLAATLVLIPLLVALGSRCTVIPGSAIHRVSAYAGRLSYPLYCLHYPLLMMIAAGPLRDIDFPILLPAFMAASLVASHLAMIGLDEPLRAWLGRRGRPA